MWMQSNCDFDDMSFGDDIMGPMICCDTSIPDVNVYKNKTPKNFGQNKSKIMPIRRWMKLYSAVYRHDQGRNNGDCFTHATVKAIKVNLGSRKKEEQLGTADLRFLVKVNMIATYIGVHYAIYDARIKFKPSPNWNYDTSRILLDVNGNGPEAGAAEKILRIIGSEDANDVDFLEDLKEVMLMIAVCPKNFIIQKGVRRYCNTDIANKIIRTANEVSHRLRLLFMMSKMT